MKKNIKNVVIWICGPPDDLRRQRFFITWVNEDGPFRPEPSVEDGKPVGHRRGQNFMADPAGYAKHYIEDGISFDVQLDPLMKRFLLPKEDEPPDWWVSLQRLSRKSKGEEG